MQSDNYKFQDNIDYLGDFPGAEIEKDRLKVFIHEAVGLSLENKDGAQVNPATEPTLSSLEGKAATESTLSAIDSNVAQEATLSALADALASKGNDHIHVQEDTALDVSDSPITVGDITSWSAGTLTVSQQSAVDISDRDARNLGDVDVAALSEAQPVTATASGTGSGSAATLDLGALRKDVDIFYDTSGAATITIQVSKDGATWRTFETISVSSASSEIAQIDTAYQHVRAYIDSNLNTLEISAKGA